MEPFVSYAQNFEDVMLWRALKDVAGGFFIDVGAMTPRADTVTRAFTERGWRGINIEPIEEMHRQFVAERPTDVNLNVALADRSGEMAFHYVPGNRALSTLNEAEAATRRRDGYEVQPRRVKVETLAEVWDRDVPRGQEVHFLKVDVEGFERKVLEGADWSRHRPWIVVVEATRPTTSVPAHEDWESILTDAGYRFAYTDGLNRFYVSPAHQDLLPTLALPPNVFDKFVLAREAAAIERAEEARAEAEQAKTKLAELRASTSWRITAPLRALGRTVRRGRGGRR